MRFRSALLLTACLIVSQEATSQVIIKRSPATFTPEDAPIMTIDRPEAVFAEGREPILTRRTNIVDPSQAIELTGVLGDDAMYPAHMPVPEFFNLGPEWKAIAGRKSDQTYVYTKIPSLDHGTINSIKEDPAITGRFEMGMQFYDTNNHIVKLDFESGKDAQDFRIFRGSRSPVDVNQYQEASNKFGLFMLFDRSGSMDDTGEAQTVFWRGLLARVPINTECALGFFTTSPSYRNGGRYESCHSLNGMSDAEFVELQDFGGGTNIYTGIKGAFRKMGSGAHRQRLLVILTDGYQSTSIKKADVIRGRPDNTKVIVIHPQGYDAEALQGIADFEVVLSQDIRNDKAAYQKIVQSFAGAITKALEGQVFFRFSN